MKHFLINASKSWKDILNNPFELNNLIGHHKIYNLSVVVSSCWQIWVKVAEDLEKHGGREVIHIEWEINFIASRTRKKDTILKVFLQEILIAPYTKNTLDPSSTLFNVLSALWGFKIQLFLLNSLILSGALYKEPSSRRIMLLRMTCTSFITFVAAFFWRFNLCTYLCWF